MYTTAQDRGRVNKLKEKLDVSGVALEIFNSEVRQALGIMRSLDKEIRTIVIGKSRADGSFKSILKLVKSNINRRQYVEAYAGLSDFYFYFQEIGDIALKFTQSENDIFDRFLHDNKSDAQKEKVLRLNSLIKNIAKEAQFNENLVKHAGFGDFIHNVFSPKGRADAAFEKRYPNKARELKDGLISLLDMCQSAYENLIQSLDEMDSSIASRKIGSFAKAIEKLLNYFLGFGSSFVAKLKEDKVLIDILTRYEQEFVKKQQVSENPTQELISTRTQSMPVAPMSGSNPHANIPDLSVPASIKPIPSGGSVEFFQRDQLKSTEPSLTKEAPTSVKTEVTKVEAPKTEVTKVEAPKAEAPKVELPEDTEKNIIPQNKKVEIGSVIPPAKPFVPPVNKLPVKKVKTHDKFYNNLKILQGQDKAVIANYIKRYASEISETDLDTSKKLFNIVNRILG